MLNLLRKTILETLKQFSKNSTLSIGIDEIQLNQQNNSDLGDLSTNAAMSLSKKLDTATLILANAVKEDLEKFPGVFDVTIAGPGFINFKIQPKLWQKNIVEIINKKEKYSFSNIMNHEPINLEFVSANPTGPLHTGHARNAVLGSVIGNLLEKIGYSVTREFYINDQGNQIKSMAKSLYVRYKEALGADVSNDTFTEDMYCGAYIKDLANELADIYQDKFLNKDDSEWIEILGKFAVTRMMENAKNDLAILGIVMDKYTSESDLCGKKLVDEALEILKESEDIYEGILQRPKGIADSDDWEERPQTLFKSTKYSDDVDRAIRKSDGTWTYFAGDIAYHFDKIKRGFKKMIAILGADHSGYVKRLQAAVKALSCQKADINIMLYQLVNFLEDGKPVKMSKRAGTFITLKDVVERVGKDVTRYMMISRSQDVMIDFDFIKVVECSMENPIFYIQYAYARICSVLRNYESHYEPLSDEKLINADRSCLTNDGELSILKELAFWPELVISAAKNLEPHKIPNQMRIIAAKFHSLWNRGKLNSELRFIDSKDIQTTLARLSFLFAIKMVLEDGFKIMGITPLTEMK